MAFDEGKREVNTSEDGSDSIDEKCKDAKEGSEGEQSGRRLIE